MKVLVLAPHADDLEFGCGGTVARLRRDYEIRQVVFSFSTLDLPKGMTDHDRLIENDRASDVLGVANDRWDFAFNGKAHRNFDKYRQAILDIICDTIKRELPDIAFIPCSSDKHQDHQVIHNEGVRGLKGVKTILGYDTPWNHMINGNYFIKLSKGDVEKKIEAIDCYKSVSHKPYANHEFLWSWARFRGLQGRSEFAEVFELIRGEL